MEEQEIKKYLENIGLSVNETEVYLFLLKTNDQLISIVAKKCKLTRTNAYDVVKKLEEKGLVIGLGGNYGKKIRANKPNAILELLKSKKDSFTRLEQDFSSIEKLFKALPAQTSAGKYNSQYFNGVENIKKIFSYSLLVDTEPKKEILWAGSEIDLAKIAGDDFVINFHERRVKKSIYLKSLRAGIHSIEGSSLKFIDLRLRPKNLIKMKSNILIWGDFVAMVSLKDNIFGILIENHELAWMLSTWFNFIWESSEKVA